jgi:methionyl-tRNA synthetase
VPDSEPDEALVAGGDGFAELVQEVSELLDRAELSQALEEIWKRVRRLNRYVEELRPWDLAKDEGRVEELDRALYNLAEGLRVTALLLHPYMPDTGDRLLAALGEDDRRLEPFGSREGGQRVGKLEPLFPKIEAKG